MSLPAPYYEEDGIVIYCEDAREIMPSISADALITDPIWPHCESIFPGIDAELLLGTVLAAAQVERIVIQLGCNSDPRFLQVVPHRFPFFRTCYLEYAVVGYLGRILRDAEVAYVFGSPPPSRPGHRVLPGRTIATRSNGDKLWSNKGRTAEQVQQSVARQAHPTRRLLQHVKWLVKWFGEGIVLDPFMGSGTTLLACKDLGLRAIGIEIEEKYCAVAVERLRQEVLPL